ncbi:MAG: arylamine N-acetyltransferase [Acidobacteriota bacterium]|nr:arylamine N-acetyltransferase [Acidobacteriota bacterium]
MVEGKSYLNIRAYLERINYHGSLAPTAETLRELQVAHLLAVPFENLSIHAKEPIVLEDQALFTKIVERRRGGFCYEANGLFAALLRALGFDVAMLSAEVANAEGEFGPNFDHMALMVSLEQRWLVDVGFGDSFREPLLLDKRGEQVQGSRAHRILSDGTHLILMQRDEGDEWKAQYRFTLQTYTYADYAEMCRYHQTSPQSHFTRARICSRATEEGRITLSEMRFITTSKAGGRQERTLTSEEEYAAILREQFGIVATSGVM